MLSSKKNISHEQVASNNEVSDNDESEKTMSENEQNDEHVSGDDEMSETEVNKSGNYGWADAMNKILHTNKPKRKKTLVLSKAKKLCDVLNKPKEEPLPFELEEGGEIKREVIVKEIKEESSNLQKRSQRRKDSLNIRVKPNVLDRERERMLQKIATKGVVALFNAVKEQQSEIEAKLKKTGPTETKREKVLQSVDKNSFLDVLMGGTKSIEVDSSVPDIKKDKKEVKEENGGWKVLRDDFVMNASMKNWDKEDDESSENEEENAEESDKNENSDDSS